MSSFPPFPVVWSEGQLLLPQHFQQQERFFLHQAGAARRQRSPEYFGWNRLAIDAQGLRRGLFALTRATGLFQDGAAFDLPAHGRLPEAMPLNSQQVGGVVCLAIATDGVSFNVSSDEPSWSAYVPAPTRSRPVRSIAREYALADETDPSAAAQQVHLAMPCLRLCLQTELSASELGLPIARIAAGSDRGEFLLDKQFMPPLLDLRAHEVLLQEIMAVIDLIRHRVNWQIERLNQPQTTSVLETTDFLLVQSLLRHESALCFELDLEPCSPLGVLRHLVTLSADMAACNYPPSRADLPEHWRIEDLGECFSAATGYLRASLSHMRERLALEIVLNSSSDGTFISGQSLPEMGHGVRIIIAVQAQVPNDWLWQRFSEQAIVGASDRLMNRVRLQMSGVPLHHLPVAPAELPLQMGWHYFELETGGQAWAELVQARSLGMHVAGQWPGLSVRGWLLQPRTGQRVTT
jgi:type VI secretion system protein ImpJ